MQAEAWHRGATAAMIYEAALKRFNACREAAQLPQATNWLQGMLDANGGGR